MAERKSILLRLRPEIYAALQRWAADEFRSVNGQIEYLLDRSLREAGRRRAGDDALPEGPAADDADATGAGDEEVDGS
jgi:hypothetical protein